MIVQASIVSSVEAEECGPRRALGPGDVARHAQLSLGHLPTDIGVWGRGLRFKSLQGLWVLDFASRVQGLRIWAALWTVHALARRIFGCGGERLAGFCGLSIWRYDARASMVTTGSG